MRSARMLIRPMLLTFPFIWQLGFAPMANAVTWQPLGLPFQLVWQMLGVLGASAAIGAVFLIDYRNGGRRDEENS